jgi:hypothetical protein
MKKWGKAFVRKAKSTKFHSNWFMESNGAVQVVEEGMDKEVFDELFNSGTLIQPTKDNKPKSVVTIIKFDTWDKVKELFGEGNIDCETVGVSIHSFNLFMFRHCGTHLELFKRV